MKALQRIRSRIGGDLQFREDENGKLIGLAWSKSFSWQPFTSYPAGHVVYISGALYEFDSAVNTLSTIALTNVSGTYEFTNLTLVTDKPPTHWVDGGYLAKYGQWKNSWRITGYQPAPGGASAKYIGSTAQGANMQVSFDVDAAINVAVGDVHFSGPASGVFYCHTAAGSSDPYIDDAFYYEIVSRGSQVVASDGGSSASPYTVGLLRFSTGDHLWHKAVKVSSGSQLYSSSYWRDVIVYDDFTKVALDNARLIGPLALLNGFVPEEMIPNYDSKIGEGGAGFGQWGLDYPDFYIAVLQEQERSLAWDSDFDWKPNTLFTIGTVVWFSDRLWSFDAETTTLATFDAADFTEVTDAAGIAIGPTAWVGNAYDVSYGDWLNTWGKRYISGSASPSGYEFEVSTSVSSSLPPEAIGRTVFQNALGKVYVSQSTSGSNEVLTDVAHWLELKRGGYTTTSSASAVPSYIGELYFTTNPNPDKGYVAIAVSGTRAFTNATYWREVLIHDEGSTFEEILPLLPAQFAEISSGVWPQETAAMLGVIDAQGIYAFSTSARVNFSTNAELNPRFAEIFDATKKGVGILERYTFFAFDPQFLPEANRRIPTSWASIAEMVTFINTMNTNDAAGTIIPITPTESNFKIEHKFVRLSDQFAIKLTITLEEEISVDEDALDAIVALYPVGQANKQNSKVIAYTDLTGVAIKPWGGTFLDLA